MLFSHQRHFAIHWRHSGCGAWQEVRPRVVQSSFVMRRDPREVESEIAIHALRDCMCGCWSTWHDALRRDEIDDDVNNAE